MGRPYKLTEAQRRELFALAAEPGNRAAGGFRYEIAEIAWRFRITESHAYRMVGPRRTKALSFIRLRSVA